MEKPLGEVTKHLNRSITRRQAIKAGGIAVVGLAFSKPLVETLYPKSAFADYVTVAGGCTPGFWKNTTRHPWPSPYVPTGGSASTWNGVFGVPPSFASSLNGKTLLQVLNQGGGCEKALGRHAVAALLNATVPVSGFPFTPGEIITIVNSALTAAQTALDGGATTNQACGDNVEPVKNTLDNANNGFCEAGSNVADD